jgi:hypothetical protein
VVNFRDIREPRNANVCSLCPSIVARGAVEVSLRQVLTLCALTSAFTMRLHDTPHMRLPSNEIVATQHSGIWSRRLKAHTKHALLLQWLITAQHGTLQRCSAFSERLPELQKRRVHSPAAACTRATARCPSSCEESEGAGSGVAYGVWRALSRTRSLLRTWPRSYIRVVFEQAQPAE